MMDANSHFATLSFSFIMVVSSLVCLSHSLLEQEIKLVFNYCTISSYMNFKLNEETQRSPLELSCGY